MKRLFDILASALLLLALSPVLLVVAFLVAAQDGSPVLFRQQRCGLGGQPFKILKFRTMVKNAEEIGGYSTAPGDPRITKLGAFLRRTSLDELPQLLNVLVGDMSLVGPRPDTMAQEKDYTPEQWTLRASVRPGLTGPAQATMRSNCTPEERWAMEADYIRNHTFLTDIWILVQTAGQIVTRGSY